MHDLHLPSFLWGALLGPVFWAFILTILLLALAFIGDALERLAR